MNVLWSLIVLFSLLSLLFFSPDNILPSLLSGATNGITLAFSLLPIYVVWSGLVSLAEKSGLSDKISALLSPITRKLFPNESPETRKLIAMNFSANLIGASGASTPLGIQAVHSMKRDGHRATHSMILFTVINVTSIQLIPTTVISLRAQAGSSTPYDVILPTLIVSTVVTVIGVLAVFAFRKIKK